MTTTRRDGMDTPFSMWVRSHPELESNGNRLSIQDNDLWCHRFSLRDEKRRRAASDIRDALDSIMLVEVKTFMRERPFAQSDTHSVIDALLRTTCTNKAGRRIPVRIQDGRLGNRTSRMVRFYGVHLLQLSGASPEDSDEMLWDSRHYLAEEHLIELIRFERDPDAPSQMLSTRRHHSPGAKVLQMQLLSTSSEKDAA